MEGLQGLIIVTFRTVLHRAYTPRYGISIEVSVAKPLSAFGFLTVIEDSQHGFFGGYLVLSELGRPLEFHCTTPVKANQAQKILYGESLRPYLFGELIGKTLVDQGKIPVQAVLTDQPDMMSLAQLSETTLALVEEFDSDQEVSVTEEDFSRPQCKIGELKLSGTSTCLWSAEQLEEMLTGLVQNLELREPFERIHEAIREAQRVSNPPTTSTNESVAA